MYIYFIFYGELFLVTKIKLNYLTFRIHISNRSVKEFEHFLRYILGATNVDNLKTVIKSESGKKKTIKNLRKTKKKYR